MKLKYLWPFMIPTLAIATVPFCTSCSRGESETDKMMDIYASNHNATDATIVNKDTYFANWQSNSNKVDLVEYTIFSFMLAKGFTIINTGSSSTDIKLKTADSLYALCTNDNPTLVPLFNSNWSNEVSTNDNNIFTIRYVGSVAFQLIRDYEFIQGSTVCRCSHGDIIQFAFDIPNAQFKKDNIVQSQDGSKMWLESYDYTNVIGNSIGIAQLQQNGHAYAFSSFNKSGSTSDLTYYSNYWNYSYS